MQHAPRRTRARPASASSRYAAIRSFFPFFFSFVSVRFDQREIMVGSLLFLFPYTFLPRTLANTQSSSSTLSLSTPPTSLFLSLFLSFFHSFFLSPPSFSLLLSFPHFFSLPLSFYLLLSITLLRLFLQFDLITSVSARSKNSLFASALKIQGSLGHHRSG